MKSNFKLSLLLGIVMLFFNFSCQEETIEETEPNQEETLIPESELVNLMSLTSLRDGSFDDILDAASCLALNLPITVTVNNITVTINTLDDLELIEAIINEFDSDDDIFEFLFPITITLNDYTTVVINDQEELDVFVQDCENQEDVIECIDFVYPISFAIYDTDFQVIETVVIENDAALYAFLDGLENPNGGAVLASLNFPVTLEYANGDTIEVNNNQELEDAINAAEADCAALNCSQENIEEILLECTIHAIIYGDNQNQIDTLDLDFNTGGELIVNGTPAVTETGTWSLSESNLGYILTIGELNVFNVIHGNWLITLCNDNHLEFTQEVNEQIMTMEMQQDCRTNNQDLLDCYSLYILSQECDDNDDGIATFIFETNHPQTQECLALYPIGMTTHPTYQDAENNTNPLSLGVTDPVELDSQTLYIRVYSEVTQEYAIQELELVVESCTNTFDCPDLQANIGDDCRNPAGNDGVVNADCECEVNVGPFDCFNNSTNEVIFTCVDSYYSETNVDLTSVYGFCVDPAIHTVTYHESYSDAENDVNPIASPSSYLLEAPFDTGNKYMRVELADNTFEIYDMAILIERCIDSCNESTLINYLTECSWTTNSVAEFELTFNTNNELIVVSPTLGTQTGTWDTHSVIIPSTGATFTFFTIGGLSGDFQILEVEYEVFYCSSDEIQVLTIDSSGSAFSLMTNDCSTGGNCTEDQVITSLVECIWNIVSYDGSDDLISYNLDFEDGSGIVVMYNNETTIDASWSVSQGSDGVLVDFSNINGPNIQVITGEWLVMECDGDRYVFQREDDGGRVVTMVMEQDCN